MSPLLRWPLSITVDDGRRAETDEGQMENLVGDND